MAFVVLALSNVLQAPHTVRISLKEFPRMLARGTLLAVLMLMHLLVLRVGGAGGRNPESNILLLIGMLLKPWSAAP